MAEGTISIDAFLTQRTMLVCRSCGEAIWNLDLEDTRVWPDTQLDLSCATCGAHIVLVLPDATQIS